MSGLPVILLAALLSAPDAKTGTMTSVPPDQVMLDELEDLYEPVAFDHRGHAEMTRMSVGCTACHHHTPEGTEHPTCKTCHPNVRGRDDMRMPSLKGAYHRQCLDCHRDWSHENACSKCHVPKAHRGAATDPGSRPSVAAACTRMGRPVESKNTYAYRTSYVSSPVVTFHHRDHAESFGLQCGQCHQGDSCGRCHDAQKVRGQAVGLSGGPHATRTTCFGCHQESNCSFCHDQTERQPFSHATATGWRLDPHHTNVPCTECHGPANDFKVPSKVCHACHARQRDGRDQATLAGVGTGGAPEADCLACHVEIRSRFEHASWTHGPAKGQGACLTCHDTAGGDSPRPTCERQREVCLTCHNQTIPTEAGRPIENIAVLLAEKPNHHGPVRDGDCTACHDPHASEHAHLLVREYASDFYAPFGLEQYALCFGCHSDKLVLSESGTGLTGFRDGDRNLHWLHVNRGKGRTCRVCHEIHASDRPFHIRESVPFSNSGWQLPLNYERATHGGGCAPGCHGAASYDRAHGAQRDRRALSG